ncbi:MAG: DUF1501 domain-containing protein [Planctomycetota bacterium]
MHDRFDRRSFLGLGVAGAGLWFLGRGRDPLLARAILQDRDAAGATKDRILVVVQLSGGNDGLNTLVPIGDPEYAKVRPRIRIQPKDALAVGEGFALHPALKGCKELVDGGKLAVIRGVGYPDPNRSHFKSMDIWHSADPTGKDLRFGWLGRALDVLGAKDEAPAELSINFGDNPPLSLNGRRCKPVSFRDPQSYRYVGAKDEESAFKEIAKKREDDPSSVLDALRRTAEDAERTSADVRRRAQEYKTPVRYPGNGLAPSLRIVAGLIAGGLPTRVYYTYHGGYDTHAGQAGRQNNLLTQLDQSLAAFAKDLERQQLLDRVTVLVFSEFGRRVRENQSGGTDHGTASVSLVMGGGVKGGLHGEPPSLTDLLRGGDLKHTVDFRGIYTELLDGVLEVDPAVVLGKRFDKVGFLA